MAAKLLIVQRNSWLKHENYVVNFSTKCHSKPVWNLFFFGTPKKIVFWNHIKALCDEVRFLKNLSERFCALDQPIYSTDWTVEMKNNSFMSCCFFQDRCQDFQWILYYFGLFFTQSFINLYLTRQVTKFNMWRIILTTLYCLSFWKLTIFLFIILIWLAFKNLPFALYSNMKVSNIKTKFSFWGELFL